MSLMNFELSSDSSFIKLVGTEFNLDSLEKLLKIVKNLNTNKETARLNIIGNFNTKLLDKNIFNNKSRDELDKILVLLQSITKIIEDSEIEFTAHLKGVVQGPALEIALSCNYIKSHTGTTLNFNFVENKQIPFFGSIQRLVRILGYKITLQTLLIDKIIDFEKANDMKMVNNKIDNTTSRKNPFWDTTFTNTFIFFNSKIHSIYKNNNLAYKVILSIIFESSICNYEVGLSIERRWLKWLTLNRLENTYN